MEGEGGEKERALKHESVDECVAVVNKLDAILLGAFWEIWDPLQNILILRWGHWEVYSLPLSPTGRAAPRASLHQGLQVALAHSQLRFCQQQATHTHRRKTEKDSKKADSVCLPEYAQHTCRGTQRSSERVQSPASWFCATVTLHPQATGQPPTRQGECLGFFLLCYS